MKSNKLVLVLVGLVSLALLVGCVGMERAPKERIPGYAYYPKALVEADRTLDAARAAGKDKECPAEFNAAKAMVDKAYEVYMACRDAEAIKMAQDATAKIKALCPAKVAAAPPPPPPPPPPAKPAPKVIDKMTVKVLFDFNKAELTKADVKELEKAVAFVKKYPGSKIRLDGHTDSIGSDAYNMKLSQKRADVVRDYLIKNAGVKPGNITAVGHGETKPVASNKTKEGRAQNRRTEISIISD